MKLQWATVLALTPLVVTQATESRFDHTTLSQLNSPGESHRQICYSKVCQSEPNIVAVSPFDLLNLTIKKSISFMNPCNTCFKAGSKGVYFPSKTKKHYKFNKTVPTPSTDPLGMKTAPKKDANLWNLAAKDFNIFFLHYCACTYYTLLNFADKQEKWCVSPELSTIFSRYLLCERW